MGHAGVSRGWLRAVAVPAGVVLALLAVAIGGVLHVAAQRADHLELERQTRLVEVALAKAPETIANDQQASTLWDDAVLRVRERPLDLDWLDNNLGVWFHTYYGHDETYLLDPENRAVYAMQGGKRASPDSFGQIASQALPLATRLRAQMRAGVAPADDAQSPGIGDILVLNRHPAVISVKPIVSETGALPQPAGTEYLHISVRYLDGSFLRPLAQEYGIEGAAFVWQASGTAALPVRGAAARPIGYIEWTPFRPGRQVQTQLIPTLAGALAVIGAFIAYLLWRDWRNRTDLESSRARAQHLAFHDPLTGLANRALLDDRLAHALHRRRQGSSLAILLLDLDRFKNVNDSYGHQAGDALIAEFSRRLHGLLREGDTVARLGGDEFAILVEDMSGLAIEGLCRRILLAAHRPFLVGGGEVYIGVSIGVAIAPSSCRAPTELLRRADIALYRAKEGGRSQFRTFAAEMDDAVKLRTRIEADLRRSLADGSGLTLHYQPTVAARDGAIIGLEALLRWNHPEHGPISPERFVPVAEESGLMASLGEWVVREACRAAADNPDLFMAVNLSPVQFKAPGFAERLGRIAAEAGVDPRQIQFEITEHVLLHDEKALSVLGQLRAAGFTIVLDDFGTGYSSLGHLRAFPVDKIKIDHCFVGAIGDEGEAAGIVTAIVALGRALGLTVAAEGVETARQRDFLIAAGCDEMQGFLFSAGVPAPASRSAGKRQARRSAA
jgi:diguanylate cyclase (GGDEF)-like protein